MADARDRLERTVGVAAAAVGAACVLSAATARADEAEPAKATATVSLGGDASAGASAGASPTRDAPAAEEAVDPRKANPPSYEFAFVSVGAYQTWSLAGSVLYFGAGGGLGPPLYRYSKLGGRAAGWDNALDIAYGNVFIRVAPVRYVDIDVGPKI